ncbi:LOW QUALITY PROTEIN: apoptosis-stimulating of p53 protein 1-like [Pecten maximus]|uniref:LOW QUALITY PROTEIN: apoptosis-stimulating of p53 protein 1-like n=1 Tax=Pecten maximus TaxID=6579 RepID=UPI001458725D|nr:LOW QUALITY PROTEIN: apoptosis-stimulating of p53 protein 1-like [Pecten maximus]
MAEHGRFTYDSNEEDWDIPVLEYINSQLESYLKMLPGGVDLTLSELQEMASRQQQQIEHQQQVLVAKEQRLKYLKQQEARHQHMAAENDRLKKLREKVENQEMKLKKLRALRGEAEKYKNTNGSINSELESVKSLFSEKEKELVMAVAKVEELTRQLEKVQHDKESVNKTAGQSAAKLELDKLKKELMVSCQDEEISKMDNRILELQQRLKKKRAQQADQQKKQSNQQSDNKSGNKATRNNVAAVEPYVQIVPKDKLNGNVDSTFHKMDPKYQSLPVSSKFVMNLSDENSKKPLKGVENVHEPNNNNTDMKGPAESRTTTIKNDSKTVPKENGHVPSEHVYKDSGHTPASQPQYSTRQGKHPPPIPARAGTTNLTYLTPRPFGTTYSTSVLNRGPGDQQGGPTITIAEDIRTGGSGQSSPASSDSSLKENSAYPSDHQSTNHSEKQNPVLNGTNHITNNNNNNSHHRGPNKHPPPYPGGSVPPNKHQGAPPPYPHVQQNVRSCDQTDSMKDTNSNNGSDSSLNSDSGNGSKQQPKYKYASKNVIANTYMGKLGPEALKKYQQNIQMMYTNISKKDGGKTNKGNEDKSHTESNKPNSAQSPPSASESLSPPANSPKGGKSSSSPTSPQYPDLASDKASHNRHTHKHVNLRRRHSDSDNEDITKLLHKYVDRYKNQSGHTPQETGEGLHIGGYDTQATSFQDQVPEDVPVDGMGNLIDVSDKVKTGDGSDGSKSSSPVSVQVVTSDQTVLKKKTNLKSRNSKKSGNRVSFDPLALLLDSSLEGELELVKRCASQVHDVSEPNDEGITALHNAICAGHYAIVKFLVEFGCDVNSPDSDGWTPLHCAASCNNLPMVKFLVEHGACIFATTISDQETAAEKCEEEEDGFDGCSEYLYSIQEKLGIMNNGVTWAVFSYEAVNSDELSFDIGDEIVILRKGDEKEKDWWWSRMVKKEGYIPRNLLGLYPRVIPQVGESES